MIGDQDKKRQDTSKSLCERVARQNKKKHLTNNTYNNNNKRHKQHRFLNTVRSLFVATIDLTVRVRVFWFFFCFKRTIIIRSTTTTTNYYLLQSQYTVYCIANSPSRSHSRAQHRQPLSWNFDRNFAVDCRARKRSEVEYILLIILTSPTNKPTNQQTKQPANKSKRKPQDKKTKKGKIIINLKTTNSSSIITWLDATWLACLLPKEAWLI